MRKGFTLIEAVIVIVIIGILAAIAIPKYREFRANAIEGAENGVIGALKEVMAVYQATHEGNPYQGNPFELLAQAPPYRACSSSSEIDATDPDGKTWLFTVYDIYGDGSWMRIEIACPHWVIKNEPRSGMLFGFDSSEDTDECNFYVYYDYGH